MYVVKLAGIEHKNLTRLRLSKLNQAVADRRMQNLEEGVSIRNPKYVNEKKWFGFEKGCDYNIVEAFTASFPPVRFSSHVGPKL